MTLARQWRGQRPFEETWFIEALLGPDRGLWVRYVIDAGAGEASVWAIVTQRGGDVVAERATFPLEALERSESLFAGGPGRLDRAVAVGSVGAIQWDLRLDDRGLRHSHVPFWARMAGVGRTYSPAVLDLRVAGSVTVNGTVHRVRSGPGVLGHLWGGRSRITRWAWAHCNAFDREDLVFEGLSVDLGGLGTLTSLVLHADGHAYTFSRTRDLVRTWSRFSRAVPGSGDTSGLWSWMFEARRDSRVLTGQIDMTPERATTVRYAAHGVTCTNTRFGRARIVLRDPKRGLDLDIKSRECAFEIAGPPDEGPPPVLG